MNPDPSLFEAEDVEVQELEVELVDDLPEPILTPAPSPAESSCGSE